MPSSGYQMVMAILSRRPLEGGQVPQPVIAFASILASPALVVEGSDAII